MGQSWDHPRIRGEKTMLEFVDPFEVGSPPHTRGKEVTGLVRIVDIGITPAYAGKSLHPNNHGTEDRDHPRIRGEKTKGKR